MKTFSILPFSRITLAFALGLMMLATPAMSWAQGENNRKPMPYEKEPAESAAAKVVHDFFDAMRAGDGEKIASLFADGAKLQSTATNREGKAMLNNMEVSKFVESIGAPREVVYDERIWDLEVQVDGRLASAWMKYAFYLGKDFSHCGANSFQMFNGEDGWKILYLVDSRQRAGCEIPEDVKPEGN